MYSSAFRVVVRARIALQLHGTMVPDELIDLAADQQGVAAPLRVEGPVGSGGTIIAEILAFLASPAGQAFILEILKLFGIG